MEYDPRTGELPDTPTISRVALEAGRVERADRAERKHARVVGDGGINVKIDAALATMQPVLKNNKLEKNKPGQRGDYTSLDRIIAILVPRLRKQGVVVRFNAGSVFIMDKTYWLPVTCYLIDRETGESVECTLPMPVSQVNPHGLVSAFTYGRRMTILGVTGLATGDDGEDDNAEAAMPREMEVDSEVDELTRELRETKTEAEANKWKGAMHKRLADLELADHTKVKTAFQMHVKTLRLATVAADDAAPKGGKQKRIAATTDETGRA